MASALAKLALAVLAAQIRLGLGDHLVLQHVFCFEAGKGRLALVSERPGVIECGAKVARVETDQQLTGSHPLVVGHENFRNKPGDMRRYRCDVAAGVGIVRRLDKAADPPPIIAVLHAPDRNEKAQSSGHQPLQPQPSIACRNRSSNPLENCVGHRRLLHGIGACEVGCGDDEKKLAQSSGALDTKHGIEPLLCLAPWGASRPQPLEAGFGQTQLLVAVIAAARGNRNEAVALQRPDVSPERRPVHHHFGRQPGDGQRTAPPKLGQYRELCRTKPGREKERVVKPRDVTRRLTQRQAIADLGLGLDVTSHGRPFGIGIRAYARIDKNVEHSAGTDNWVRMEASFP